MYRVLKIGGKYYALEIADIEDDLENIQEFIDTGSAVILCQELDDLETLDIFEKVELVEPD